MKVLFLNPPINDLVDTHFRMNPSTAPAQLSAVLRQAGHKAYTVDMEALQLQPDSLGGIGRPDVIGMSITCLNIEGARRQVAACRRVWPDAYYVAGGPHATGCPDEVRQAGFDCVVRYEADWHICQIVEEQPKGIFDCCDYEGHDLDELPLPDWGHFIPEPRYYLGNEPREEHPEGVSLWNRGCPHQCLFCSHPVYQGMAPRHMSPARVRAELEYLKADFGVRHVFVYSDELIGMTPHQNEWLVSVCQEIQDLGLTYKTQGRCSKRIEPETFEAMKAAGFKWVFWGIESLSRQVLDAIRKGTTPDDIWYTLEASRRAGLNNLGFLMVGCLEETEDAFQETYRGVEEMLKRDLLQWMQVTVMRADPGSQLYDMAKLNGWLTGIQQSKLQHYGEQLNLPWASRKDILRRQKALLRLWFDRRGNV